MSLSCSYDFTPLDSSAVYVLSSMARQRRTSLSSGGAISPDCDKLERSSSPQSSTSKPNRGYASGTASSATPTKCKRPMNAFMLFAKKYRVEYTQMYPGKDNRYSIRLITSRKRRFFWLVCVQLCRVQLGHDVFIPESPPYAVYWHDDVGVLGHSMHCYCECKVAGDREGGTFVWEPSCECTTCKLQIESWS